MKEVSESNLVSGEVLLLGEDLLVDLKLVLEDGVVLLVHSFIGFSAKETASAEVSGGDIADSDYCETHGLKTFSPTILEA